MTNIARPLRFEVSPIEKPRLLKLDDISAELYVLHLKDRGCDAEMEPLSPMPGYSTIRIRRL